MLEGQLKRRNLSSEKRKRIEKELAGVPLPLEVAYIWRIFQRLSNHRDVGFGPAPLKWSEIEAFQHVTRFALSPWEISQIEMLDGLWMTEQAGAAQQEQELSREERRKQAVAVGKTLGNGRNRRHNTDH